MLDKPRVNMKEAASLILMRKDRELTEIEDKRNSKRSEKRVGDARILMLVVSKRKNQVHSLAKTQNSLIDSNRKSWSLSVSAPDSVV